MFSWRGLGFIVPLVVGLPFFVAYGILSLVGINDFKIWIISMGVAALISPFLTYFTGKKMNKESINHSFCEIRFEHWAVITAMMEYLVVLCFSLDFVQKLQLSPTISDIFFWFVVFSFLVTPIVVYRFIKKNKLKQDEFI